jgi:hypothetical protein
VHTVFTLNSPSYALLQLLPTSTDTNLPRQDLFCPSVLQFCKRKK